MSAKPYRCPAKLLLIAVLPALAFGACKAPIVWHADVKSFVNCGLQSPPVNSSLSNFVVSTVLPNGDFSSTTTSYARGVFQDLTSVTFSATGVGCGQLLRYKWNGGNWTAIGSGVTSPTLTVAENTAVNNGTDDTLQVAVTSADGTETTTYTVQFSKGYRIVYDGNWATAGSVPTDSTVYEAGQTVSVLGPVGSLTEPDGTFNGWNSAANGSGTSYAVGSTFTMGSSDLTVYARWQGSYVVGNTGPASGIVFYDKGFYSSGWRFLSAAATDQSTGIPWAPNNTAVGTISGAIGAGKSNTQTIVTTLGTGSGTNYAAYLCANLSLGGYTDWFLPSLGELGAMYNEDVALGLNLASAQYEFYWSSTETSNPQFSMTEYLYGGGQQPSLSKGSPAYVRAIREF